MSEEMQTNNTIKRKRASASMAEWETVTIQHGGNICIMTESDLAKMDKAISRIPQLEQEVSTAKAELKKANANEIVYKNVILMREKKAKEMEKMILQQNEKIEGLEQEKIRLQETYKALAEEYSKLKVFKENAGRGRRNVLTPEDVGLVRQLAMSGHNAIGIHRQLEEQGVDVSYETVRKLVAEARGKGREQRQREAVELFGEEEIILEDESAPVATISSDPLQSGSDIFGTKENSGTKTISEDFNVKD